MWQWKRHCTGSEGAAVFCDSEVFLKLHVVSRISSVKGRLGIRGFRPSIDRVSSCAYPNRSHIAYIQYTYYNIQFLIFFLAQIEYIYIYVEYMQN